MSIYDDIDDKLKLAHLMCSSKYNLTKDKQFNFLYPYTTENIFDYLPFLDLYNKSVLTVGSSGDQALNSVYMGAKDVTVSDICPFTKEYYLLKKAAIMSLSRDEYINFFSSKQKLYKKNDCFSAKTYNSIREALRYCSLETCYFWDQLFGYYNGLQIRKNMFLADEYNKKVVKMANPYLFSKEDYHDLATKIDLVPVSFKLGDIFSMDFDNTYGSINLSNIGCYNSVYELRKLFLKLANHMENDGVMLLTYLYDTDSDSEYTYSEESVYNIKHTLEMFPEEIDWFNIPSMVGMCTNDKMAKDSVIIYKKVKKKIS